MRWFEWFTMPKVNRVNEKEINQSGRTMALERIDIWSNQKFKSVPIIDRTCWQLVYVCFDQFMITWRLVKAKHSREYDKCNTTDDVDRWRKWIRSFWELFHFKTRCRAALNSWTTILFVIVRFSSHFLRHRFHLRLVLGSEFPSAESLGCCCLVPS